MMIRKQIMLVLFNLKRMYIEKKALFLLVIISTAISTFGIFFFGDYLAEYYKNIESQMGDCLYIEGNLKEECKPQLINGIKKLKLAQVSEIICGDTQIQLNGESCVIKGEFHNNFEQRMLSGKLPAWNEKNAKVVLDEFQAENIADTIPRGQKLIGYKLNMDGKTYTVSGICSTTEEDELIVPVLFYLNHYSTNQVKISFQHTLSSQEKEKIEKLFAFDDLLEVNWTALKQPWEQTEFMLNFVQLLGVFVCIGINVVVLIQYLLYRNKRKYCIYSICGGADRDIHTIIFNQIFIHMLLGTVSGLLLFRVFKFILGKVEWLYGGNWYFYMWIFVLIILIQVVTSCILEWKMRKNLEIYQVEE